MAKPVEVSHHELEDIVTKADVETLDDLVINEEWRSKEKGVVKKLDMTLMPMVWILYLFNYLDRNNISQSKLNNIEDDLGLVGNQFNTAISILNVGYMIMQVPSNMILTRVRPSLYLPFWACVWSCISAATAASDNYTHLVVIRFLLGVSEAPFFPGVFYLLSCWYTKRELGLRMAVLYSGLVVATAFSGLIAAGVFANLDGTMGLSGWRWLYIIEGAISFVLGLIALFILPDFPESKTGSQKWLFTEEELQVANKRIELDRITQESDRSVFVGFKLAVKDYRTWLFILMLIANHTAYGFNYFYPSIVKGLNLGSNITTLCLTAPPYIIGAIASFAVSYSSDRRNERGLHVAIPMCVAIVGFVISVSTLNHPARYAASFLYITGCFAANGLVYSWAASVLNQTPEKKAVATSMVNVLAQLGNIWSPYFFRPQDATRYVLAMLLMIAFAILSIITCMVMKWDLKRQNRKLEAEGEITGTRPRLFTT